MNSKIFGGNKIRYIKKLNKNIKFKGKSYDYFFLKFKDLYFKKKLNYFTIYLLSKYKSSKIFVNQKLVNLSNSDCVNFYNFNLKSIRSSKGPVKIFVSGVYRKSKEKPFFNVIKKKKIYTVKKPWGYEKWLNGRGKYYAFKKIFLKSNFKTSLQFHRYKSETNILYNGKAQLVYKKNQKAKNIKISKSDINKVKIKPVSEIYVKPKTLHRIVALSNINLFETSTPHLDDVIRVADDVNRPSGLIKSEHLSKR